VGEKALERSAYREAMEYFERALRILPHLPETRDTCAQAIDLRLALRSALHPSGSSGRILELLREAESLAAALNDPRRLGRISGYLSRHYYLIGSPDQAVAAAERTRALATTDGEVVQQAVANQRLGLAYEAQGDYRRAIDCLMQAMVSLEGARRYEHLGDIIPPAVSCRARLAMCHAELGRFAEGRVLGEAGLQLAEVVAHPGSLMFASYAVGLLSLRQGDLPRALPCLERAVSLRQDADLPIYFTWVAAALGAAYTLSGRVVDAVALLTQTMDQRATMENVLEQVLCRLSLGEAYLRSSHLEEAHALTEHTLTLAQTHQERSHQAYALCLLGEIAAQREPTEVVQAEEYFRQALTLADELGMRPLQAHCHLGLGTLYCKISQREEAHTELVRAIEMYRAMDMTFWLPQVEAVLAQVEEW
jgi:tetratricopeptide (TPR) repeat protein